MWQAAVGMLVGIAALIQILEYFGIRPKHWQVAMNTQSKWRLWLMIVLVAIALGMSAFSLYSSLHRVSNAQFQFSDKAPLQVIQDKKYVNETVDVDGREFEDCNFSNVTLVYDGVAPYEFVGDHFDGSIRLLSRNPSIVDYGALEQSLAKYPGISGGSFGLMDQNGNVKPLTNFTRQIQPPEQ